MVNFTIESIEKLKSNFAKKNIAVIGDLMLDCYYTGKVNRISPEAPVPVLDVEKIFKRIGGAANVAFNIASLGGNPFPVGVIGNDTEGNELKHLLQEARIINEGIIIDSNRPTTTKTRVIAEGQHVVRIDNESKKDISTEAEQNIISYLNKISDNLDAVILEDYNKGVLTKSLISKIIDLFNAKNILITVDPKKNNFFEYKNVSVFKPNKKETEDALNIKLNNEEDIENAGLVLLNELNAQNVIITLGEKGMAIFKKGEKYIRIPTRARKVADVSGAGDTVIATLTMAICSGLDIVNSSSLANYAAGIVCEEVGIVPIDKKVLFNTIEGMSN